MRLPSARTISRSEGSKRSTRLPGWNRIPFAPRRATAAPPIPRACGGPCGREEGGRGLAVSGDDVPVGLGAERDDEGIADEGPGCRLDAAGRRGGRARLGPARGGGGGRGGGG